MKRKSKLGVGVVLTITLAVLGAPASAAHFGMPVLTGARASHVASGAVTLLTGDRVEVRGDGGGPQITPGAGRSTVPFRVSRSAGHLHVVPGDAAGMIAAGRLDPRLFDVTSLLDGGFGDVQGGNLSLIVQYRPGSARSNTVVGKVTRQLPALEGEAVAVAKKDAGTWWSTATRTGRGSSTLNPEYAKVWLNGKRRLALDHSAPQIGAPIAWQSGLTGKGVDVAVLDSGIDSSHPDLAGKVDNMVNFTDETAGDRGGHGTHVASIIAGTGAASGGQYRGIAPDAHLLDVKVCTGDGLCPEDAIVAGMEWAAATGHAPIANLSLGALDTPGVDPLEQAVDTLSAQYGTLFVVAAGNSGPFEGTIESPGSADAALTVGAVDRQDAVADFSSRGFTAAGAVKPDLTAPGVDIVADRAAGTELGEVVDEQYVRLSGTSMATPHVSGAAAILRQQHPDWSGEQLKEILVASARTFDGAGVLDQGAGRVDIAKALTQVVTAAPTNLSYGVVRWPHDPGQVLSKTVTYHNTGSAAATLSLTVAATGPDGGPAPAVLFTVNPQQVMIPPGGSATATVTADVGSEQVPVGRYVGRLVAAGAIATMATPLGVEKESERYEVQLTHLGRDGATPSAYFTFLDRIGDCGTDLNCGAVVVGSQARSTVRLPPGQYTLAEFSTTAGTNDTNVLFQPVFEVAADTSVTLDARRAKPMDLAAPKASARVMEWDLHVTRDMHRPGTVFDYAVSGDVSTPLFTADLGGPTAEADELMSFVQARAAEPGPNGDYMNSPYEYEMAEAEFGHVFTGLRLHPQQSDFATVQAQYSAVTSKPRSVKTQHVANPLIARPELADVMPAIDGPRLLATAPFQRSEYYLADGLKWTSNMQQGDVASGTLDYALFDLQGQIYQAGHAYEAHWAQGVFGPQLGQPRTLPGGGVVNGVERLGDQLYVNVPLFVDADSTHSGLSKAVPGTAQLYRDGQLVMDWPSFTGDVTTVPAESATYRLETTVTPAFSEISTSVHSSWTFESGHVDSTQPAALPLLAVRYRPVLDERNHARPGRQFTVPVDVARQPGAGAADVSQLSVEVSYDDGVTWHRTKLTGGGGHWRATVDNRAGHAVSLRTSATDTAGNRVEQTTIRAYLVDG